VDASNLVAYRSKVFGRIFGPRREEVTGDGKNCLIRSFIIRNLHKTLLG
jgi:hypothetical protein